MRGKWHVLVIIDDYSRYSLVFFLESKDEVFEHFRRLALRLNNEYPNCLKSIHSDNVTEFRNASFDQFCLEHSIDQPFFTPRVPQQNEVMEQNNPTLVEMASMILDEHMCDRTTSEMRGLPPKIISGDSRRSENAQTHTNKHTVPTMKFKLKLLHIKCHVLGFTKDKA
jgi:transposase InsO family protein